MSNIKKEVDQVSKQERDLTKLRESLKSACTHTKKGELTLVKSNRGGQEGSANYICKQCQKDIVISRLSEAQIDESIDILDRMIDTIKISADPNRDDDEKMIKQMAKIQYRLRNEVRAFYNASLKKNSGGNRNNRRNNNRDNTGGWNRPNVL